MVLLPRQASPELWRRFCSERDIEVVLSPKGAPLLEGEFQKMDYFIEMASGNVEATAGCADRDKPEVHAKWYLGTSGTTGDPKLVGHTLSSLARTVKSNVQKGQDFQWGLLYDLHRFAGLQVFLQAFFGGSTLIFPEGGNDNERVVEDLLKCECNALSATPSLWRKIMMTEHGRNLPLRLITLGGEIADEVILNTLSKTYPDAKVSHIYASTEAGVGFSVTDGLPGFPYSYLDDPPQGVRIAVNDDGILLIRPEGDISEMKDDSHLQEYQGGQWVATGDEVEAKADRYYFLGRSNGTINVGGAKVYPEKIEALALTVDGVVMALAQGRKNPILGQVVELIIQPESGMDTALLQQNIECVCKQGLLNYECPALIRFEDQIELTETGKRKVGGNV